MMSRKKAQFGDLVVIMVVGLVIYGVFLTSIMFYFYGYLSVKANVDVSRTNIEGLGSYKDNSLEWLIGQSGNSFSIFLYNNMYLVSGVLTVVVLVILGIIFIFRKHKKAIKRKKSRKIIKNKRSRKN